MSSNMTVSIYRSFCFAVCLALAACTTAPTPPPMRSEKVSKPSVQKPKPAQPERPKTRTSATFALLRDADSALAAAQPKQAILLLERAVRIEPRNFELWIRLSRAHLASNNLTAATQHARKAIALADTAVDVSSQVAEAKAWLQYAQVLEYRGQKQEAASIRQRYSRQRG